MISIASILTPSSPQGALNGASSSTSPAAATITSITNSNRTGSVITINSNAVTHVSQLRSPSLATPSCSTISGHSSGPSTSSSSKSSSSTSLTNFGSSGSVNQRLNSNDAINKRYSGNLELYNDAASMSPSESAISDFKTSNLTQQLDSDHLAVCFKAMNAMRYSGQLCDVVLKTDSPFGTQQLPAHRLVLAASSAYFFAMFNGELAERNRSEVTLHSVDALALKLIVDFCYTGEIIINQSNVQHLLPASNFLQIETVREACCKFLLSQLEPSNCLGIRSFADANCCVDLQHVEDLVSSSELNVPAEECVYKAIMRWVKHEPGREKHLERLLRHCRLPLVDRHFLLSDVSEEPLVQHSEASKDLIMEAMKYHLVPEKRSSMTSIRTTLRRPEGLRPYLFAVGGGSLFAIHSDCEYYNPRTDRWLHFAPTMHRRSRAGVASLNRLLYAIGGFDGIKDLSSAEVYNPQTNAWSLISPLGTRRSCLGVAALNGLLYIAGGYDGCSCLSSVEQFDPLVGTWSSLVGMDSRRRYCRLTVLDGCLYAVGGHDGANYQSSVERLDPREGRWRLMPAMSSRRTSCGAASLDRALYAVGGNDASLCMNSCEKFDIVANAWTNVANMHCRRTTHEVVQADGVLFAVGGNDGTSSLNSVEMYDARENSWTQLGAMQLRRSSIGAAVIDCPQLESLAF
ncbi:kelch-like protein 17 isoform X2 [Varroa jacobsoni]|uniref:BTB domain-containing protein n=1 Tax=Varroa destructor TaxID=109461 RepID=A0A7M7KJX2_VARDE|nr:kelch-like protein 17 isoform X2 [Varroa destructor]XP_022700738.1 kelch-like protein 17 isoform X2 [Varroa jacobsoni]